MRIPFFDRANLSLKNERLKNKDTSHFLRFSENIATVEERIFPEHKGRVRFQGSFWPAQCERIIQFMPGDKVQVIGRRNITLIVDSVVG